MIPAPKKLSRFRSCNQSIDPRPSWTSDKRRGDVRHPSIMRLDHPTMRRRLRLSALALVAPLLAGARGQPPRVDTLVLPNVTVIDGTGAPPRRQVDVLIRDTRIVSIRPTGTPLPAAAQVLEEFRGMSVMPGLIDSHVHLATSPRDSGVTAALGRAVLLGGVTSLRDMGGNTSQLRRISAQYAQSGVAAPRLYTSAVVAGAKGPWNSGARSGFLGGTDSPADSSRNILATDESSTVAAIASLRGRGIMGIKLLEDLDLGQLRAATRAARAAGLRVWSHWAIDDVTPMQIVRSGVDAVSHADMASWAMIDGRGNSDSARLAQRLWIFEHGRMNHPGLLAVLDTMRARDVALDATLLVFAMAAQSERDAATAGTARRYQHLMRFASAVVRTAHERGVRIVAGTDALGGSTPNLHADLQLLVDSAGLSPLAAIQAATRNAAHVLGIADSLGTVSEGMLADLVIVDGDPSTDIRETLRVRAVVKNGALFRRERPLVASGLTQPPTDSARIARVERRLWPAVTLRGTSDSGWSVHDRMRAHAVAGLSVAVVHRGRVAWSCAYGVRDRATGDPMTTGTLLQAGSLSKPMAATIAMSLVQAGTLTLDDDVNRWLRAWTVPRDSFTTKRPVTLRLLLSHRAGFNVSGFDGYARDSAHPSVLDVLRRTGATRSDTIRVTRLPGSAAAYSGGGYLVAQQVMTDATGQSFETLSTARLFEPLGLARSTYSVVSEHVNAGDISRGYLSGGRPVPGGWRVLPEQAPASLWTTPTEYARFIVELQRAFRGDSSRVLSTELARAMMTTQGSAADEQGIGVGLKGNPPFRFSHTGWNDGFRSIAIGYLDRGEGIVVLTNADDGDGLAMEYVRAVAREYGWADLAPQLRTAIPLSASERTALVGRYRLGRDWQIEIAVRNDTLVAGPTGRRPFPLFAESRDEYFFTFAEDLGLSVRRDAAGHVVGVVWKQGDRHTYGARESRRSPARTPIKPARQPHS